MAKATASVRILNQCLLAASLKVARAKMGYGEGRDPDLIGRIGTDVFNPMDWDTLVREGLVQKFSFKNRDIEKAFVGTAGEGLDAESSQAPGEAFTELYFAHLNVPAVGRNLLSPERWAYLQQRLEPGDHALLLVSAGRYPLVSEDFVRGAVASVPRDRASGPGPGPTSWL